MKFDVTPLYCICGKLCTSKPGLTLHHRNCEVAKEAISKGESAIAESSIIAPDIKYDDEVQQFLDLAKDVALDAHRAIHDSNKLAGRRARTALIELRDRITPLRKRILGGMKDRQQDNQSI